MKKLGFSQLLIAGCIFLSSCSGVMYLGDHLPASNSVQVYYDAKDVKRDYKVIGHLGGGESSSTDLESTKTKMIERAKSIGADGIIFVEIYTKPGSSDGASVKADAIKFNN
ncbi:MAG TPA: hypothetical protein VL442_06540 [Mucilaginibacter sp.]|jgi:hypothetical protein|nr:hypothetical protein [Mucilaginibacter sp.]